MAERVDGRDYVGADCTINGRKAMVVGRKRRFARIIALDRSAVNAEWSWDAVARIMGKGGAFRT